MRLILCVFDALQTFARPATRAELEREAGLDKDAVCIGLRGLRRRGVLVVEGGERQRAVYALVPGAARPSDLRGRRAKTDEERARIAAKRRGEASVVGIFLLDDSGRSYRAAMAPSHHAQPGALRHATHSPQRPAAPRSFGPCLLAALWRKR